MTKHVEKLVQTLNPSASDEDILSLFASVGSEDISDMDDFLSDGLNSEYDDGEDGDDSEIMSLLSALGAGGGDDSDVPDDVGEPGAGLTPEDAAIDKAEFAKYLNAMARGDTTEATRLRDAHKARYAADAEFRAGAARV